MSYQVLVTIEGIPLNSGAVPTEDRVFGGEEEGRQAEVPGPPSHLRHTVSGQAHGESQRKSQLTHVSLSLLLSMVRARMTSIYRNVAIKLF